MTIRSSITPTRLVGFFYGLYAQTVELLCQSYIRATCKAVSPAMGYWYDRHRISATNAIRGVK